MLPQGYIPLHKNANGYKLFTYNHGNNPSMNASQNYPKRKFYESISSALANNFPEYVKLFEHHLTKEMQLLLPAIEQESTDSVMHCSSGNELESVPMLASSDVISRTALASSSSHSSTDKTVANSNTNINTNSNTESWTIDVEGLLI
jgi:hypothetical protein